MKKVNLSFVVGVFMVILLTLSCNLPFPNKDDEGEKEVVVSSENENKDLGEVYSSTDGGYSFQVIPDFELEEQWGISYMYPADADPDAGPMFILIGGMNEIEKSTDDLKEDFLAGFEGEMDISKGKKIKIDGKEGVLVEYEAQNNGKDVKGQAIFVAVTPYQVFSLIDLYPPNDYKSKQKDLFEAVSETVRFFEPTPLEESLSEWEEEPESESEDSSQPANEPPAGGVVIPEYAEGYWDFVFVESGMTDTIVRALAVSPDGTLWIGYGSKGIASYKEGSFTNYTTAQGLTADSVSSLAVALDGSVWIGTGWGISRFDGSTFTNYLTDQGLLSNDVKSLTVDREGNLWAGVSSGVSKFDGSTWTNYTMDDGIIDKPVVDIAIDDQGGAWFATRSGVSYLKDGYIQSFTEADGLSYKSVNSVAVAPDGAVWFTTDGQGATRYDGSSWQAFRSDVGFTYTPRGIAITGDGSVWFGSDGTGVFRYNGSSFENWSTDYGFLSTWVDVISAGPDGTIWISFKEGGLARFGN